MLTNEQREAASKTASALESCDWSDVPLGQKMIVLQAINLLLFASAAPADGREKLCDRIVCARNGGCVGDDVARGRNCAALATAPMMSEAARDVAVNELRNIVNARRFDRSVFECDGEFADWAQNRARYAISEVERIDRAAAKGESE